MNGVYDPKRIMRVEYQGQVALIEIERLILENGLAATNDPMFYFGSFLHDVEAVNLTIQGRVVPETANSQIEKHQAAAIVSAPVGNVLSCRAGIC